MARVGRTAVVMMDTRSVRERPKGALHIQYPQLAFELNRGYACAHGYDLLYLHMQTGTSLACAHVHVPVTLLSIYMLLCSLCSLHSSHHTMYVHVHLAVHEVRSFG